MTHQCCIVCLLEGKVRLGSLQFDLLEERRKGKNFLANFTCHLQVPFTVRMPGFGWNREKTYFSLNTLCVSRYQKYFCGINLCSLLSAAVDECFQQPIVVSLYVWDQISWLSLSLSHPLPQIQQLEYPPCVTEHSGC